MHNGLLLSHKKNVTVSFSGKKKQNDDTEVLVSREINLTWRKYLLCGNNNKQDDLTVGDKQERD